MNTKNISEFILNRRLAHIKRYHNEPIPQNENVAEHTYFVTIIARSLCGLLEESGEKINKEEVMEKEDGIIIKEDEDWVLFKRLHGNFSRTTELPNELKIKDIVDLKEPITKHIEKRDFRMVSQSIVVVAYRPFWGGRADPSGGVDAELKYALTQQKEILAFHPDNDGDPETLFRGFETAIKKNSLDEIFAHLKTQQESRNQVMQGEKDTWE